MAFFKGVETEHAKTKGKRRGRKQSRMTRLASVRRAAAAAKGKR